MLRSLDLTSITADTFEGESCERTAGIFGGQLLGQAVVAATRVDGSIRTPSMMQAVFLRTGDPGAAVQVNVEPLHTGRSFSTHDVRIGQGDRILLSAQVTFHHGEQSDEHHPPMPAVVDEQAEHPALATARADDVLQNPVEIRAVDVFGTVPAGKGPTSSATAADASADPVWMRCGGSLPDDIALHSGVLAYLSDYTILAPVLLRHGWRREPGRFLVTSLNHVLWWHDTGPAEEWMLYDHASLGTSNGRGLAVGRLYGRSGRLLATVGQQGLFRAIGGRGQDVR